MGHMSSWKIAAGNQDHDFRRAPAHSETRKVEIQRAHSDIRNGEIGRVKAEIRFCDTDLPNGRLVPGP